MHGLSRLTHILLPSARESVPSAAAVQPNMSDEAAPPRSLEESIHAACDGLEQYHKKSIDNKLERTFNDLLTKLSSKKIHKGSKPSLQDSNSWCPPGGQYPPLLPFRLWNIQRTYNKGISAAKRRRQQKMQHLSLLLRFQQIPLAIKRHENAAAQSGYVGTRMVRVSAHFTLAARNQCRINWKLQVNEAVFKYTHMEYEHESLTSSKDSSEEQPLSPAPPVPSSCSTWTSFSFDGLFSLLEETFSQSARRI
jgi:hypothetical protein